MAFFNNFNIGFRKFIGLSGLLDTSCGDFSYVYTLGGYMDYYQSIAPLADAIDKVASPASCIRPYAFINNVVSQVDENNFLKWLRYPNQTQTGIKFRKEGFEHYLITGNNFIEVAYVLEENSKKIISYKNLNPRYITVKLDNNNEVEYYEYQKASLPAKKYERQLDSTNFKINSNRFRYKTGKTYYDLVVWQDSVFNTNGKDFSINGLGKSKLQSLQDEMLLYRDGNKSNKATFKNSLTAKKMLVIDLAKLPAGTTQEQMEQYKKKLVDEYSGSQNSGKTIITTLDVKTVDLQNPFMARDLEFNIGLRRLRVAFYNAYNIPLPLVEGEFTSNSNMKESNLNLYDSAVLPLLEDYFEFVYVYLIKDFDDKTKIESINYIGSEIPAIAMREAELVNQLSNANIVTKNELRQRIGLGAITGLNAVYVDGNQAPIGEDTNTGDTIGAPLSQVKELVFEDIDDYEIELLESEEKALSDIDLKPTESMANNARRGLELREKFGRGGTAVGVARARDISNRKNLSPSTVGRMVSFFARHGVNEGKNKLPNGDPSNHYIAWCLTHDTEILLADGSLETIGNIVNNKMNVEVMSKQEDGSIKPAKIINWLKLPSSQDDFMVLRRGKAKSNECGVVRKPKLYATKEHPIFTGNEYTQMQNLTTNNKVAVVEQFVDNISEQVIFGHIMGDGYLSSSGQLKISRCDQQLEYLEDTIKITKELGWCSVNSQITKKGFGVGKIQHRTSTKSFRYLLENPLIKIENKKRIIIGDLDRLTDIAVSRWILDDGSLHKGNGVNARPNYRLHIEGYNEKSAFKIAKWFESRYKGTLNLHKRENCDGFVIYFGVEMTQDIAEKIAKYVPYSMRYKLPESLKNIDYVLENYICQTNYKYLMQDINYIRNVKNSDKNEDNSKFDYRYDLTIDGTHNFIANGIIVHNCLWGGNSGRTWANAKWKAIKREREK